MQNEKKIQIVTPAALACYRTRLLHVPLPSVITELILEYAHNKGIITTRQDKSSVIVVIRLRDLVVNPKLYSFHLSSLEEDRWCSSDSQSDALQQLYSLSGIMFCVLYRPFKQLLLSARLNKKWDRTKDKEWIIPLDSSTLIRNQHICGHAKNQLTIEQIVHSTCPLCRFSIEKWIQ
jgi:hypothetical protein